MKFTILKILFVSTLFFAGFFHFAQAIEINEQPDIRVGLFETTDWVKIKVSSTYQIVNANGKVLKTTKYANKQVRIKYRNGKYLVRRGSYSKNAKHYIKIIPTDPKAIITITSYEDRPTWNTELNDNMFRGQLEVQEQYVINELPLEKYLKGVCEAGDNNDKAYLKTLYTAARTYAIYHYLHPTKHADEPYLLDNTSNDQVYCGYGFEQRAPYITKNIKKTRGKIITYDNEVVVTPYFSTSDGRTRSWSEVWNGDYPYLISVDDPGCEGMTLNGHGVGLSAEGARYFAETEDWTWKEILKYYYTGIKIKKVY